MKIKEFIKKYYIEIIILFFILLILYGGWLILKNSNPDVLKEILPLFLVSESFAFKKWKRIH